MLETSGGLLEGFEGVLETSGGGRGCHTSPSWAMCAGLRPLVPAHIGCAEVWHPAYSPRPGGCWRLPSICSEVSRGCWRLPGVCSKFPRGCWRLPGVASRLPGGSLPGAGGELPGGAGVPHLAVFGDVCGVVPLGARTHRLRRGVAPGVFTSATHHPPPTTHHPTTTFPPLRWLTATSAASCRASPATAWPCAASRLGRIDPGFVWPSHGQD